MGKLIRLRILFIVYFAVKVIIDLSFGTSLVQDVLARSPMSSTSLLVLIAIIDAILFGVGLLLFKHLVERKSWARILLLVIAWVTVFDAVSGALFASRASSILGHFEYGVNWERLLWIDRVTDALGFLYWGYFIYVLQMDRTVRGLFLPPADEAIEASDRTKVD